MRLLLVFAHPSRDSLTGAVLAAAEAGAAEGRHECRVLDLHAEAFDPVMPPAEWRAYEEGPPADPLLAPHLDHLRWAEGIVLIHPVWWGGPPAILKGWLDRAWATGVAFETGGGLTPKLDLRVIGAIVTMSASRPIWALLGEPGRRMTLRVLKSVCVRRGARSLWLALHGVQNATPAKREAFLARVRATVARLR